MITVMEEGWAPPLPRKDKRLAVNVVDSDLVR